ncbi:UNVERIFIED_CONTAM: hypothetical protein Sradi_5561600 [Sesamum radiatum]|uniref:Uncharacterized protein n=1 Tax=Sesamum radiatum TaxID=300843 RepID=A0AAW2LCL0_SESRA
MDSEARNQNMAHGGGGPEEQLLPDALPAAAFGDRYDVVAAVFRQPAACLMSARRNWASSGESEVLSSTFWASRRRPCKTSQRGDSGMASTPMARKIDGTAPTPSISRHPSFKGSLANA